MKFLATVLLFILTLAVWPLGFVCIPLLLWMHRGDCGDGSCRPGRERVATDTSHHVQVTPPEGTAWKGDSPVGLWPGRSQKWKDVEIEADRRIRRIVGARLYVGTTVQPDEVASIEREVCKELKDDGASFRWKSTPDQFNRQIQRKYNGFTRRD